MDTPPSAPPPLRVINLTLGDMGRSLVIWGHIYGVDCRIVCDTGAGVTVISTLLFEKIQNLLKKQTARPPLTLGEKIILRNAAKDSDMEAFKLPNLPINLGNDDLVWDVVVADIQEECLLGIDFLKHFASVIDLSKMEMHMKHNNGRSMVKLAKSEVFPANTINYVKAQLVPPLPESEDVLIEPVPRGAYRKRRRGRGVKIRK